MSTDHAQFPTEMLSDRRAHPRRTVDLLANRFVDGQPSLLRVTDLSETGLRGRLLGTGGAAARFGGVQFQLPDMPDVLTASAEVLDAAPGEIRLRFTVLTEQTRRGLARFIASTLDPQTGPRA